MPISVAAQHTQPLRTDRARGPPQTRFIGLVIFFIAEPPPHDRAWTERSILETATQPGGERLEIDRRGARRLSRPGGRLALPP